MIIDSHAHVFADPKLTLPPANLTFMSADQQIEVMNRKGIDAAVVLPLNNAESPVENQSIGEVLGICNRFPGRFIPFCNVDPRLPRRPDLVTVDDFLERLTQYRNLGCRGFGELIARLYFDDPVMLKLFEACMRSGFPVVFHITTPESNAYGVLDDPGFPRMERVLKLLPDLFLIGHSPGFWNEISGEIAVDDKLGYPSGSVVPGGRVVELLRNYPNLYADLSGRSGLNAMERDEDHAYRFLEEFQDRILFGMDYCFPSVEMRQLDWLRGAVANRNLSQVAFDKICGGNIARLLHLEG